MRDQHDLIGPGVRLKKDCFQDLYNKVHRRDIIIMDEDAIEWLEFGLFFLFLNDLNFRCDCYFHVTIRIFFKCGFLLIAEINKVYSMFQTLPAKARFPQLRNFPGCAVDSMTSES